MKQAIPQPLRAAACLSAEGKIVHERNFEPGADVVVGGEGSAGLIVPGWSDPPVLLISAGVLLHLSPGMRVNMCGDHGEERIVGTYEELVAAGIEMPIPILGRRMNISVRDNLSIFAKYL